MAIAAMGDYEILVVADFNLYLTGAGIYILESSLRKTNCLRTKIHIY